MNYVMILTAFCSSLISTAITDTLIKGEREGNVTTSVVLSISGDSGDGGGSHSRRKRSVFHLFNMMTCATPCNPLDYKGYGCYCGFLGSGVVVDGIDKCCAKHDWCYYRARCSLIFVYFASYLWTCQQQRPRCGKTYDIPGSIAVNQCSRGHPAFSMDSNNVERVNFNVEPFHTRSHVGSLEKKGSVDSSYYLSNNGRSLT